MTYRAAWGSAPCGFGAYKLGLGQPHSVGLRMMLSWSAWLEQVKTPWHHPRQGHRADLGIPSSFIQEPKSPGRAKVKLAHQPAVVPLLLGRQAGIGGESTHFTPVESWTKQPFVFEAPICQSSAAAIEKNFLAAFLAQPCGSEIWQQGLPCPGTGTCPYTASGWVLCAPGCCSPFKAGSS